MLIRQLMSDFIKYVSRVSDASFSRQSLKEFCTLIVLVFVWLTLLDKRDPDLTMFSTHDQLSTIFYKQCWHFLPKSTVVRNFWKITNDYRFLLYNSLSFQARFCLNSHGFRAFRANYWAKCRSTNQRYFTDPRTFAHNIKKSRSLWTQTNQNRRIDHVITELMRHRFPGICLSATF